MKSWIKDIGIACLAAIIIVQFVQPTIVRGTSMEPTLKEYNYIFMNKQLYRLGGPCRGDVVVCHSELTTSDGKEKKIIKRVIGLPGDTIAITDGEVYVNGTLLEEPYLLEAGVTGDFAELIVPEGHLFVMGDNRRVSEDSRSVKVGCVPLDEVIGKAFFRLYPFTEAGLI